MHCRMVTIWLHTTILIEYMMKTWTHAHGRSCRPAVCPHEHAILLHEQYIGARGSSCQIFPHKSINEHTLFGTTLDSTGRNLINQSVSGIILTVFC